jgi:hypothetical protein
MSLEDDLHNVGPALDRAIDEAAEGVSRSASSPRHAWSRPRAAVVALAVAASVAAAVGVVVRLDSSGRHGVATTDSSVDSSTASSTTGASTTSTSVAPTTTSTIPAGVPLQSVRWASVVYPMAPDCGVGMIPPVSVGQVAYAHPADGVEVAVVLVRCTVGAGTPPVVVYVYDAADSIGAPHLMETLLRDTDGWQASDFRVDGATIALPVSGFSSRSLPNCCPDVQTTLRWSWTGSDYRLESAIPPHIKYPW